MKKRVLMIGILIAVFGCFIAAQDAEKYKEKVETKKMSDYSEDHKTIDSIISATYDVISGAKDQKRDWDRFRLLFDPSARLIPAVKNADGTFRAVSRSPDEYISASEPFLMKNGFFEKEISRKAEIFGNIAHIFSTYEARYNSSDEKPFLRGINSFQLINDGKRWWVLSIFWQAESSDFPLPAKYLEESN